MTPVLPPPSVERLIQDADLALIFLRWAGLRAMLGQTLPRGSDHPLKAGVGLAWYVTL
jgi:hypothetical protein